jgi:hypothetical protein
MAAADEARVAHDEDATLGLVLAVISVAVGIGIEDTGVSLMVLAVER